MRLIDADALKSYLNENEYADMYYIEALFGIIDRQPTVSPDDAREVGEWIKAHDDTVWWWECSVCHEPPLQRYKCDRLSNFCPNCGAKMEVAE